jgi:CRP-like cAMP-binding protein
MGPERREEARAFLLSIPVFGGLPERSMEKILELVALKRYTPGEAVCAEGELGREMFVVWQGAVEVQKRARDGSRGAVLARLGPGDCFGEMSLIDIQPRSATVITREESELFALSNIDFYRLYSHDREGYTFLVLNICRELSRRLRRADGVIADFYLTLEEHVKFAIE